MLSENMKNLRKNNGYTQEELVNKNRRSRKIWKTIGISLLVFLIVQVILAVIGGVMFHNYTYTGGTYTEEYVEEIVEME